VFNYAPNKPHPHTAYFFRHGVSRSLLFWLLFRQSLCQPQWAQSARENIANAQLGKTPQNTLPNHTANYTDDQLLDSWLPKQQGYAFAEYGGGQWLIFAGLLLGFSTMGTALAYTGERPVNLWVLLGIFSLLPLAMSMLSLATFLIRPDTHDHHWILNALKPWLNSTLKQFNPLQYEANNETEYTQNRLIKAWLLWKLQWFALAFQLSAIVAFITMVTFQQYSFAWFSTNIEQGNYIIDLLQSLSLPWQWALPAPTPEFITTSRFTLDNSQYDANASGAWWSYLALAMTVYGLIPRLLVTLWIRLTIQKRLTREIHNSGEVERFIQALRLTVPGPSAALTPQGHDKAKNHTETSAETFIDDAKNNSNDNHNKSSNLTSKSPIPNQQNSSADRHYIAWQENIHSPVNCEHTIGNASWQQDESWITDSSPLWQKPLCLVAKQAQTPTAELADLLILAQSNNKALYIEILLLTSEINKNIELRQGQRDSWKYFCEQYKFNLTSSPENPEKARKTQGKIEHE